jgi:hypothetical protein
LAPSEIDTYFRQQMYKDMCMIWRPQWKAELLDTLVSFSNAMDVAKMMQLFFYKRKVFTVKPIFQEILMF